MWFRSIFISLTSIPATQAEGNVARIVITQKKAGMIISPVCLKKSFLQVSVINRKGFPLKTNNLKTVVLTTTKKILSPNYFQQPCFVLNAIFLRLLTVGSQSDGPVHRILYWLLSVNTVIFHCFTLLKSIAVSLW